MMRKVSVLMTVYNGMPYLVEAVDSVRRQTLEDWKLIIVDDGSTDGTAAWLDGLNDPRIQVIHQANAGAPAAANRGLELCDTEFVARMDADDVADPRRLQLQRDFLAAHPRVGLVGAQVAALGATRAGVGLALPLDHDSIMSSLMSSGNGNICHSCIMVRTTLLKQIGGYWTRGVAEDHDMYLRLSELAELANLPELLLYFRVLDTGLTNRHLAEMRARRTYACESTLRRRQHLPPITFEEFLSLRRAGPWWKRVAQAMDVYGMRQYRVALSEILGGRPAIGYPRLAWAAMCAPHLTVQRLIRVVRHRCFAPRQDSHASAVLECETESKIAT